LSKSENCLKIVLRSSVNLGPGLRWRNYSRFYYLGATASVTFYVTFLCSF